MFPHIPSSTANPASSTNVTERLVDDLIALYTNQKRLVSTAATWKDEGISRQQLVSYIKKMQTELQDVSDPPSPLHIKRCAWRMIDPLWKEKPRSLKLYSKEELIDSLFHIIIEKTLTQAQTVKTIGISASSLQRKVNNVRVKLELEYGETYNTLDLTVDDQIEIKTLISSTLVQAEKKASKQLKPSNTLPPLPIHTKKLPIKTSVGILPNIRPSVVAALSTTRIATPSEVIEVHQQQLNMKNVKVPKNAAGQLTNTGTATCYAGALQRQGLTEMEAQQKTTAAKKELNEKKLAEKKAFIDSLQQNITSFLQSASYNSGEWEQSKRGTLEDIAKLFGIVVSNFKKKELISEIKSKILSRETTIGHEDGTHHGHTVGIDGEIENENDESISNSNSDNNNDDNETDHLNDNGVDNDRGNTIDSDNDEMNFSI